ncbi:MAG: murein biosynthesis integral membrane protein MurJ [Armatimonadetes bacterium]|nr:murein biosynthesis integral membrane protein MurJ [Armatimonadota bacterium]MDE2207253.1 murein biosynthesis integral membrane protein MurJ [Armatimonadota bacterium]
MPPMQMTPPDSSDPKGSGSATGRPLVRRSIAGATAIMMAGILGSRILALIRDRVIAHQFGQGFATDTYNGAFTVPDLIFFLIAGGAFSSAFIPVFSEYVEKGKEREAWQIFSVVASIMGIVVAGFIVLGEVYARRLVILTNPGYVAVPGKVEATVALTRILLPAQICFFLGGLMMGTLQVKHRFGPTVLGPLIYNTGIICGGLFLAHRFGVAGLCIGAVTGAVLGNLLLQWLMVRRMGGYFLFGALRRHWRHPGVRQVGILMLPVIFGLALPQVSTIIGKIFASRLGDGPQSALMNANRLMHMPLGIFAQSTAQAAFPTMAAQAARGELSALRGTVNYALRRVLFLTVPSSVLLYVLALPAVQTILQTGAFGLQNSQMAAACLRLFAVGLFAWSGHAIVTRGFYALKDSVTPVVVGTVVTAIFIPMNFVVLAVIGTAAGKHTQAVAALAGVTSIAAMLHMLTMLALLRRRLGGIEGGRLLASVSRIVLASAGAGLVCTGIRNALQRPLMAGRGSVTLHALALLVACSGAAIAVYAGLAFAFRMEETEVIRRIGAKLLRRRPAD